MPSGVYKRIIGVNFFPRFQKGYIPWNKNKKCPQLSISQKGKHKSPETEFKKGHIQPKEWIKIQRQKVSGENNWNWKGEKINQFKHIILFLIGGG